MVVDSRRLVGRRQRIPTQKPSSSGSGSLTTFFWKGTLGIKNILKKNSQASPKTSKSVALPYVRNDPIFSISQDKCSLMRRKRWVVHFGQEMLQTSKLVPSKQRLPKHRLTIAKEWLPRRRELCKEEEEGLVTTAN
jgi:hypothetical protein